MKINKKILELSIAFLCMNSVAVASHVSNDNIVSGHISDSEGSPLGFANITVYGDSTYVSGAVSEANGYFSIDCRGREVDSIAVRMLGYATVGMSVDEFLRTRIIHMSPTDVKLGEVVVSGSIPATRLNGTSMVTNVENSVLSMAGTANDVLANIPLVMGKDGYFTVLGRGVPVIYINGRQVRNPSELDQLDSHMIKSVEVIGNPGAQYAANVSSVIKIKTLRRQGDGFGLDFKSSNNYNRHFKTDGQIDMKFRSGGLEIFGIGCLRHGRRQNGAIFNQTTFSDDTWQQTVTSNSVDGFNNLSGKIGFCHMISDVHSVGAFYEYGHGKSWSDGHLFTDVAVDGSLHDRWESLSNGRGHRVPSHTGNVYYNGVVADVDIDFNADYMADNISERSTMLEHGENFDKNINLWYSTANRMWAEKLVLSRRLWRGRLSIGEEATGSRINYRNVSDGTDIPDNSTSIRETNIAVFAEYSVSVGRYNLSGGMRYEHADCRYFSDGRLMSDRSRRYGNIFPSVSVSTQISDVNLAIGFTSRTRRPDYSQLDGNTHYVNHVTCQRGNPSLKPVRMNVVSATAMWKYLYLHMVYDHEVNSIFTTMEKYNDNPVIRLLTFENVAHYTQTHIAIGAQPKVGCWNLQASVALLKQWYTLRYRGADMQMGNPFLFLTLNNTLRLPHDWIVNADFSWQSDGDGQNTHLKSSSSFDIGVTKRLLNGNLVVNLKGSDLFNCRDQRVTMYNGDIRLKVANHTDTRSVRIRLTYKFNTSKNRYRGKGAGEAEKTRIDRK